MPADRTGLDPRPWLPGLYLLALFLLVQPVLEVLSNTWPPRLNEVGWRFGAAGLGYNLLGTVVIAVLIAAGAAALLGHRRMLRTVSVIGLVLAALLLMSLGGFALDALQLRPQLRIDVKHSFNLAVGRAALAAILAAIALILIGVAGVRASRRPAREAASHPRAAGEGLVVGQG